MVAHLAGAVLAPVAMHLGLTRIGGALYALYGPFCHQYPFRSWFLFGEAAAYLLREPVSVLDMSELATSWAIPRWATRWPFASATSPSTPPCSSRASSTAPAQAGQDPAAAPLAHFVFGILPMFLDGGVQWLSYALWQLIPALLSQPFETIPAMRTLTGASSAWASPPSATPPWPSTSTTSAPP